MNFRSDNILGCPPVILDALARANTAPAHPYGNDPITARLNPRLSDIFEHDVYAFPVSSGTAANGLSLATVTPPWGAIFCHALAHIAREEWCAAEFFTSGARLISVSGANAHMDPAELARQIHLAHNAAKPSTLSITQTTEAGTVHSLDQIAALVDVARRHSLNVQMDGARFTNALVALGCSPADMSWRLGVDALALGATKNGTLTAEAVVVFRKDLADELAHRRKRAGQVSSKMRFLSAQLEAYFTDDLWLNNARAANRAGQRLADGMTAAGVELAVPAQANLVFPKLAATKVAALRAAGFEFLDWPWLGDDVVRLVCGFSTSDESVDRLIGAII
ncbi:MAG: beta-eliminating lyase-related protein [Acidobacteriota bacterium]